MVATALSLRSESIDKITKGDLPVIIFGASVVGELLFHIFTEQGVKVDYFCENQHHKIQSLFCGLEVVHTSKLKERFSDAHFIVSAADINDIVVQLNDLGFTNTHIGGLFLEGIDILKYPNRVTRDMVKFAASACTSCHDGYMSPDKISVRSIDIMITEKCSMKCVDCANLMQYFENPVNYEVEDMIAAIDNLCMYIDEVHEFRLIGGEPFMNKNFHLVLDRLIREPKVKRVAIYTNGTILPKEHQIESLRNPKVILMVTDYDELSRNLSRLEDLSREQGIAFHSKKAQGWTDCSKIHKHNRTIEEQKEVFKTCCAKSLNTLSAGELHICPFSANVARLKAVPDFKDDYINVIDEPKVVGDYDAMKRKMKEFLLEKEYLEVCDYCSGRRMDDPQIKPAIQTKKRIEYTVVA